MAIRAKVYALLTIVRFIGTFGVYVFAGSVVLLLYWNLESDPLTIEATPDSQEWVTCKDRAFSFQRRVVTTKFLEVHVAQELVDLQSGASFNLAAIPPYSGPAGDRVWTYTKTIPDTFRHGDYEYRPTLTYQVNPIKTITKAAPGQKVHLTCGGR